MRDDFCALGGGDNFASAYLSLSVFHDHHPPCRRCRTTSSRQKQSTFRSKSLERRLFGPDYRRLYEPSTPYEVLAAPALDLPRIPILPPRTLRIAYDVSTPLFNHEVERTWLEGSVSPHCSCRAMIVVRIVQQCCAAYEVDTETNQRTKYGAGDQHGTSMQLLTDCSLCIHIFIWTIAPSGCTVQCQVVAHDLHFTVAMIRRNEEYIREAMYPWRPSFPPVTTRRRSGSVAYEEWVCPSSVCSLVKKDIVAYDFVSLEDDSVLEMVFAAPKIDYERPFEVRTSISVSVLHTPWIICRAPDLRM